MIKTRVSDVVTVTVCIAECFDCDWTYLPPAKLASQPGKTALLHARAHAANHHHRAVVHRSTEYDGQRRRR